MGGILLDQPLPVGSVDQVDPFLLIHHWDDILPGNQSVNKTGVDPHPHRGFSPVTLIFEGSLHHRDSIGNDSIVNAGGTQWMNSGSGIVHSERPSRELAEEGGRFEIIQIWINTPSRHKLDPPEYFALSAQNTPQVLSSDGLIKTGIIAGRWGSIVSPIATKTPLLILRLEFTAGGKTKIPIGSDFNLLFYVLSGKVQLSGVQSLSERQMAIFENDGNHIELVAKESGKAILLAGLPLNEPVASYGPFVMNSQREIMQAIRDYQEGLLGVLEEKFST